MGETPGGLCSVNTGRANHLVAEAFANNVLADFPQMRAEVKFPEALQEKGRFDFAHSAEDLNSSVFAEVKSATLLREGGLGAFPDAVSERATKHVSRCVT